MSFDLSSTASSDDSSIIDISALLPGGNDRKIDHDENKSIDSSSKAVDNEHNTNDHQDTTNDGNRSEWNHIGTPITKQSLENSSEEANEDCQTSTIRVIMGKSVKNWRRQRNHKSKPASNKGTTQDNIDENSNIRPHAKQPNYVVVQQRDASSHRKIRPSIDFENSHLNVQRSSSGSNARVDIVEESSTTHNQKKETTYTTKKCKCQISMHGNHQASSLSSSVFVDCIAIWDPKRHVYVLEVPELIASDIAILPSSSDDDYNTIAATGLDSNHPDASNGVTAGNLARRRRQDPLKQQRQDDTTLLHHQKRRRA
jgi:hypothetical protein